MRQDLIPAHVAICLFIVLTSGCNSKMTPADIQSAREDLKLQSAELRKEFEPLASVCERPFQISEVTIETVEGWLVKDNGKDIMSFDVTFQVSGSFTETLYSEVDYQKIADQQESVLRDLYMSVDQLNRISPVDAQRFVSATPPLRQKGRMFRMTCLRGEGCRFQGSCVAQFDGLDWQFSKIAVKAISPVGSVGCKYRLTEDKGWVRDRNGEANRRPKDMTSFRTYEWFAADNYDLGQPAVTNVPPGAELIDLNSDEFNAPLMRIVALSREADATFRTVEERIIEDAQKAGIRFRGLDSKVWSFAGPDADGVRRNWLIEFKFYKHDGHDGVALCRLADKPFTRRAYHLRQPHLTPKLEFGPASELGPDLFGTELFIPGYFTEVAFEVAIREPNDCAIRIRGEEVVLKATNLKSTLMSHDEAEANAVAKTAPGNRWLGTCQSIDGKVLDVALTITNDEYSTTSFKSVLEFPGTSQKPLIFTLRHNDWCFADWPISLNHHSDDRRSGKVMLELYIDGKDLVGRFNGDEIRFTRFVKVPISK